MEQNSEHPMVFSVKVYCLQEEMPGQSEVNADLQFKINKLNGQDLSLCLTSAAENGLLSVEDGNKIPLFQFPVSKQLDCCQAGSQSFVITFEKHSYILQFKTITDMKIFQQHLRRQEDKTIGEGERTGNKDVGPRRHLRPEASPLNCYEFHSCLSQQQSVLQDYGRTATYHKAILLNEMDFKDKVVLDVGGSGMLSFFALQAGAAKVYSLQSGPMATYTQSLVQSNDQSGRILVLNRDLDSVVCPEEVDLLLTELTGHLLLSDPQIHKVLSVKKWLKSGGLMFPSWADVHLAPFSDEQLYFENYARAAFWQQRNFYGINLSPLHNSAVDEFFRQPIVDTFEVQILMSRSVKHQINFKEATPEDLQRLEIPFMFTLQQSGLVHGLAFWFDLAFQGSKATVWMSTAPTEPLTRWYQVRCLFQTPLFAKMGQTLTGTVLLAANDRQSYDIHITATIDQSGFTSGNVLDLKNPFFRQNQCVYICVWVLRMPSWFHS
ncbi:histone-arginine methyltransferase CARM1-like [Periophthalmus magnuspinnatus]|uniref:histone-arginine methyltransferase CARM1-like n=1 Tax=Periophthalmus magnuspinnatus TaxID=409849 RepID=UPI002436C4DE|nr:histone-arginine methyltransferase CARM1-like [Periophthalmus magnuspinnatus]